MFGYSRSTLSFSGVSVWGGPLTALPSVDACSDIVASEDMTLQKMLKKLLAFSRSMVSTMKQFYPCFQKDVPLGKTGLDISCAWSSAEQLPNPAMRVAARGMSHHRHYLLYPCAPSSALWNPFSYTGYNGKMISNGELTNTNRQRQEKADVFCLHMMTTDSTLMGNSSIVSGV